MFNRNATPFFKENDVVKTYPFDIFTYPYAADPADFDPKKCQELYDSHFATWVECDELGYDGFFFSEHHFTSYNVSPSPNLLVAALAKQTSRMRLGVMCNVVPFHNPLRLAEETAMLDYLTNGRLDVGLGRGADAYEFEKMGIPHEEARAMFEESLDLMHAAWEKPTFTHTGRYWNYQEASIWPRPMNPIRPWVTCVSPETVEFAGRQGYGMATAFLSSKAMGDYVKLYHETAAAAGKETGPAQTAIMRNVVIAGSQDEADEIAAPALAHLFNLFRKAAVFRDLDHVPKGYEFYSSFFRPFAASVSYEDLRDSGFAFIGTPEKVRDQVVADIETTGAGNVFLFASFGDLSADQIAHTYREYSRVVMPALRDLRMG